MRKAKCGQQEPVEVVVQFEQPRSRPPSLNGRFPASKLPAALPQRGHLLPVENGSFGAAHKNRGGPVLT
ncbi:hypothetical protein PSAB6_660015 [Paraburkholderia sabiae]|nr:hypothetical protein PSAB6_660015 [Paraburkholderia sabiae]